MLLGVGVHEFITVKKLNIYIVVTDVYVLNQYNVTKEAAGTLNSIFKTLKLLLEQQEYFCNILCIKGTGK